MAPKRTEMFHFRERQPFDSRGGDPERASAR